MTYDYVCTVCNPRIVISISDQVLMSDLLDRLRGNNQVRSNLRIEISECIETEYKLYQGVLQYFLGLGTKNPITYADWNRGTIAGDINAYPEVSAADRQKINDEQEVIFHKKVEEQLTALKTTFEKRQQKSMHPQMMVEWEIATIRKILIKGLHKLEGKPVRNELIKIGDYKFTYSTLESIRDQYEAAVGGVLDYSIVPSEKQVIAVAALNAKVTNMVHAVAFGKFLNFLEDLNKVTQSKEKTNNSSDGFNSAEIDEISRKIDELKKIILAGQDEAWQHFHEKQAGQEVIFNEFDELKAELPNITKKKFRQLLIGKLGDMAVKEILSKETMQWVWKKIVGSDFPSLNG